MFLMIACQEPKIAYLLEGDAVVRDNGEHAGQQVLDLSRDVGRGVVHPLDDLLTQFLKTEQHCVKANVVS